MVHILDFAPYRCTHDEMSEIHQESRQHNASRRDSCVNHTDSHELTGSSIDHDRHHHTVRLTHTSGLGQDSEGDGDGKESHHDG